MCSQHSEPAPVSGRRLSRLLARWADARRLDARQAEAIRQRIVAEPPPPDFDWWWRLLDPAGGSALRALPSAPGWEAGPDADTRLFEAPGGLSTGLSSWAQDDADFRPYLRLT